MLSPTRAHPQAAKPMQKFKKKTVFFLKTAPGKVDSDNLKKLVRRVCGVGAEGAATAHTSTN